MIFVHLGAGAGDLDEGANYKCGFTKFVKENYNEMSSAYLVEANPLNIEKLKLSYEGFKNTNFFNLAISNEENEELTFYYSEDDFPHYQVASYSLDHVKKHYPASKINTFTIKTTSINNFFENCSLNKIDHLSIDIEGLDFEVLMSINFEKYNIKNISIEYLHLSKFQKKKIISFLTTKGFSYCGFGYDHNNFDYLFVRKKILWNIFLSKMLHLISTKHYKFLNLFILNKK